MTRQNDSAGKVAPLRPEDAAFWQPVDVLRSVADSIDAGEIDADAVLVVVSSPGKVGYFRGGPMTKVSWIGLLEYVKALIVGGDE